MRSNSGQSLFEVIIALGVCALVLVGAISLSTSSVRNSSFARNNAQATKYAQEGVEWLREERDEGWDEFRQNHTRTNLGSLSWNATSCDIANTIFCRRIVSYTCQFFQAGPPPVGPVARNCGDATTNLIDVTIEVTWTDGQGDHNVRSATTLSRWK
jgi:hypothetical protein